MSPARPSARPEPASPDALLELIADCALDRKAHDVVALDVGALVGYTDWLLICSGTSERQTKAISDAILRGVKDAHGITPRRVEGLPAARWILMDYLDVVVHVFTPALREFYRLEHLWGEAPARSFALGDADGDQSDPAG